MGSLVAADADIWRFQPHPEVWLVIAAVIGFGWWITHVLGPKAVAPGEPIVERRHKLAFAGATFMLWVASDWPMHDVSEEYLYSVHMVQHLLITLVVPPLFLLATPEWLARLIVSRDGSSGVWVRRLTRPVVAAVLFNFLAAITHLTYVVNFSVENGFFHYFVHLIVFISGLLMWMPVASPLHELRAGLPGQAMYLFFNSVLPTVPGGFLTFATGALYRAYDHDIRLWGISVVDDQQAAGLVMKVAGGMYIWTIIGFLFFKWVRQERGTWRPEPDDVVVAPGVGDDQVLTFEAVKSAFDSAGAAPPEAADH